MASQGGSGARQVRFVMGPIRNEQPVVHGTEQQIAVGAGGQTELFEKRPGQVLGDLATAGG
jgi:hypothetical protein